MKFTEEHIHILHRRLTMDNLGTWARMMAPIYKERGATYRRFLWDWFWISKVKIGDGIGVSTNCGIVGDYNDDHITTALRFVAKSCNISEWSGGGGPVTFE